MTLEEAQRENLIAQTAWFQADTRYRTALAVAKEKANEKLEFSEKEELGRRISGIQELLTPNLKEYKKPKKEDCDLF